MKNKLQEAYPQSVFQSTSAETVYVTDFTERTGSARKIEIHTSVPCTPDGSGMMDCLKLNNREAIEIEFCLFDDHQFKDECGKDISHCECCFFPFRETSVLGFIEIKDCKAKNVSTYKDKVKEQILSTMDLFRSSGIVEKQKVYGIISFPRKKKMLFNDFPYRNLYEMTQWVKDYGIHLIVSNEVNVNGNSIVTI